MSRRPDRAKKLHGKFEFRIDGEPFNLEFSDGGVELAAGPASAADLVVTTDTATILDLGFGALSPDDAVRQSRVELEGDRKRFAPLPGAFRFPAADPPQVDAWRRAR